MKNYIKFMLILVIGDWYFSGFDLARIIIICVIGFIFCLPAIIDPPHTCGPRKGGIPFSGGGTDIGLRPPRKRRRDKGKWQGIDRRKL